MSIPTSNVLFGRILDALNKDPGNEDNFKEGIATICIAFTVLGAINLFSGTAQVISIVTLIISSALILDCVTSLPTAAGVLLDTRG